MGNRAASNIKFHEPIRGKGKKRMLKKMWVSSVIYRWFQVIFTSPKCKDVKLETFMKVSRPREFRRPNNSVVICHELLGYASTFFSEKQTTFHNYFFLLDVQIKNVWNHHNYGTKTWRSYQASGILYSAIDKTVAVLWKCLKRSSSEGTENSAT